MKLRSVKNKDGTRSWFVDYRVEGARKRFVLKGVHTPRAARVSFADFVSRFERKGVGLPTQENLTLKNCLEAYLEGKSDTRTASHLKTMKARVLELCKHFGDDTPVKSITLKTVQTYRQERQGRGDSPPTINQKTAILKAAIAEAVKEGKLSQNVLEGLERLSDRRPPAWRYLSESEVDTLLSVLRDGVETKVERLSRGNYLIRAGKSSDLYALVVFLLNTGARLGEALSVHWKDVSFERGLICLHTTKRASRGRRAEPRYIPMNQAVRELLEGRERIGELIFNRDENLQHKFNRVCELAGIGHCRIHDLRHTFASGLATAGVPLNTIRELLGHTTLTMTLRYAHLCPSAKADAVETLNFGAVQKVARVLPVAEKTG